MAKDPVCGMDVEPSARALQATHMGVAYYFCSESCRRRFLAAPEKVLAEGPKGMSAGLVQLGPSPSPSPFASRSPSPSPSPSPSAEGGWTCPMHPDVVRPGPGDCPYCGMALEPRTASLVEEENVELRDMTRRFWVGVALSLPLLLAMFAELGGVDLGSVAPMRERQLVELALATPIVFWCGWPLLVRGWRSVATRNLNMFTLIALGVGVAYAYSVVGVLLPGTFPDSVKEHGLVPVYFEAAA
ncbi:MAG: YHS domain-containing protein, partial [Methanobacteriota archaeon]